MARPRKRRKTKTRADVERILSQLKEPAGGRLPSGFDGWLQGHPDREVLEAVIDGYIDARESSDWSYDVFVRRTLRPEFNYPFKQSGPFRAYCVRRRQSREQ